MEKAVTFTNVSAVFTKDFDTFGKMDPYLVFSISKSTAQTQVAEGAGKQPKWKQKLTLTYLEDQKKILVKAWEKDNMSDDFMGEGNIDTDTLNQNGTCEVNILLQNEQIGIMKCDYSVKVLPPSPFLTIQNICCTFLKPPKIILSSKPLMKIGCGDQQECTKALEETNKIKISWPQKLRVKLLEGKPINFQVCDQNPGGKVLLKYDGNQKQFKCQSGTQKFYMMNQNAEPLGEMSFDFETTNFCTKEESQKFHAQAKKDENNLSIITITNIKGKMKEGGEDIYFKISVGSHTVTTKYIENAKKDFVMKLKESLYSESPNNKVYFAAYDKDIFSDDILGCGEFPLANFGTSGDKIVSLKNKDGEKIGDIIITAKLTVAEKKSITLNNIQVKLTKSGDFIGSGEPYIIAKMGGFSSRTEAGEGQAYKFQRQLKMNFNNEKEIEFEVWDDDVVKNDKLFTKSINIQEFKEQSGTITLDLEEPDPNSQDKKVSQLIFSYQTQNLKKKEEASKDKKKEEANKDKKSSSNKEKNGKKVNDEKKKTQADKEDKENENKQDNQQKNQNKKQKLPKIVDPHHFGDKIFEQQSSATMQRSILVYSMPKGRRFIDGPRYSGQPSYYVDSCFGKYNRGAGFGYGSKKQFPAWMEKNMKQNPAPGSYFSENNQSNSEFRPRGPTFGISHKYYEKVTLPKQKKMIPKNQRLEPINFRS